MKLRGKIQIALLISTFIFMMMSPLNSDQGAGVRSQGSGVRDQGSGISSQVGELMISKLKWQEIRKYSISKDQYSLNWDGKDKDKVPVSSGMYSYKLKIGSERSDAKKILLLR